MKKLMTVKGVFNDAFTNYEDKESSFSFVVDDELDCTCGFDRCIVHQMPDNYVLSDL